ncbi:MAG: hypothetical protein WCK51_04425 [Armatimonadota bacterium]
MTKSAKVALGMMAVAALLLVVPMMNFIGLIKNEKLSESDPEFTKYIGPEVEIPAPSTPGTERVEFEGRDGGKGVRCLLPKGTTSKDEGFAYSLNDAIVSVICEGTGAAGQGVVSRFANSKTQPVRTSEGFKGAYEERDHPNAPRRDRMYYLGSPKFSYSMMISWPHGNAAAKKDAEALASAVSYSVELAP